MNFFSQRMTTMNRLITHTYYFGLAFLFLLIAAMPSQLPAQSISGGPSPSEMPSDPVPSDLGVVFVPGSTSQIVIEKNGKRYVVDASAHTIRKEDEPTTLSDATPTASTTSVVSAPTPAPQAAAPSSSSATSQQTQAAAPQPTNPHVYKTGDDLVFSVPTGRRLERHGFYINFTHRFPYSAAFSGQARGAILLGLDDIAIPSFGIRYGVTSRLSVSAYRSPSLIGRPIELMAAYNFLDENDGQPFNASVRFSVDGQDDFTRNFTDNFELTLSRSLGHYAQLYAVPTLSIHNRPLLGNAGAVTAPLPFQPCSAPLAASIPASFGAKPCANTFSLGVGAAVDIRPTVALVAETIPTLANARDLGIHRPAYAFGIQKRIWRHAFTFGFTNSPGTTVSQRAGTRATFLGDPTADKPSGLFVGFDLSRQIY
jgi:hypothetical protein